MIKQGDDQYITLVDVPQSEYPPHQVGGTYYVRLEGSTRKASHAIVEALFNRRKPRYQQVLIEHFKRKIVKFLNNRETMTALYFLALERQTVPEPRIIAAVFRGDRVNSGYILAEQLKRDLDELASQAGILVYKRNEEIRDFYGTSYHGYKEYLINPDYQDLLADVVFEMHRQEPFHVHYD